MKAITLMACATACAAMVACKSSNTVTVNNPGVTHTVGVERSQLINDLTGDWAVMEIQGQPVVDATEENYPYLTLALNETNPSCIDFFAYNGCNFINGTVALNGSKLTKQGEYASTLRMCPDAVYEMGMATALEQMRSLKVERLNNEWFLYLQNATGGNAMVLRKHNINFLDGAWRVTKVGNENIEADAGLEMVIDLANRMVHGNSGCNVFNGNIDIDMEVENGISFSSPALSRMMCPQIELEQRFIAALGTVTEALPSHGGNVAKLLNAAGQTVIEMRRMTRADLEN